VERAGRIIYSTRPKLALIGKPHDSAPQAIEGMVGSTEELTGEFGCHSCVQHANPKERRMVQCEATKDTNSRLNHIASRIARHWQGVDCCSEL
jgi:hypothetical protein